MNNVNIHEDRKSKNDAVFSCAQHTLRNPTQHMLLGRQDKEKKDFSTCTYVYGSVPLLIFISLTIPFLLRKKKIMVLTLSQLSLQYPTRVYPACCLSLRNHKIPMSASPFRILDEREIKIKPQPVL